MNILLVEDDDANVLLFVDVLEAADHVVTVERDGLAGYERARSQSFDLIILDVQLPRMRGDEVCQRLRSEGTATAIIALSAHALPDQVQAGLAAGFDRYLTKPVSPAALREAVVTAGRREDR